MTDKCLKVSQLRFSTSVLKYFAVEAIIIPKYLDLVGGYNNWENTSKTGIMVQKNFTILISCRHGKGGCI